MTANEALQVRWDIANLDAIAFSGDNVFTVDVEEWFQVGAFETTFGRDDWSSLESRVELQTFRVLELLDSLSVQGTFFCLGWVAERYPRLIADIAQQGHEIACHGTDHQRLFNLDQKSFRADILASKKLLEDASGAEVVGYRAPSFSLTAGVWWAYDLLEEAGFRYSSSLYPVKTDHYGMEEAPRQPFYPTESGKIVEIPMTVCDVFSRRIPASGGGYFRLLPYGLSEYLMTRGARQASVPAIYYMHPWEMDPGQPFVAEAPWLSKFRHYSGQSKLPAKLKKLCRDFRWGRMKDIYEPLIYGVEAV